MAGMMYSSHNSCNVFRAREFINVLVLTCIPFSSFNANNIKIIQPSLTKIFRLNSHLVFATKTFQNYLPINFSVEHANAFESFIAKEAMFIVLLLQLSILKYAMCNILHVLHRCVLFNVTKFWPFMLSFI